MISFFIGLVIGEVFGVFFLCLFISAGKADRAMENDLKIKQINEAGPALIAGPIFFGR